jgi:dihydroorotase
VHREQPAGRLLIRARTCSTRAPASTPHDVLVRDGEIAELARPAARGAGGRRGLDGEGRHLFPGLRRPARAPARPGQEHKEDLDSGTARRGGRRLRRRRRDAEHRPGVDDATVLRSLREAARARRGSRRLPRRGHARAGRRRADRDGRAARRRRARLHRRRQARCTARDPAQALQYQRLCGGVLALHEEDPSLSATGVMHEGEVSARLGLAGHPVDLGVDDDRARRGDRGYEDGPHPHPAPVARESVEAVAEAKARGVRITAEARRTTSR